VSRADTTGDELVRWKQLELLRIAARDLIGLDPLERTTVALADLSADVLDGAALLASALVPGEGELAVIGMGKLGGHELNYASDIDVVFVGDGPHEDLEKRARALVEIAKRCFRVDTNLRPQGRDGPLVRSLDSYEAYWDRWAEPWEFQALLKARPVAGSPRLGRLFADTARRWLWSRPFAAGDLRDLRRMKHRSEAEVARRGLTEREIKRGRGGIRDIEFTVQLLQLVHGPADPGLRSPTTLDALAEMADAGAIDQSDANQLADAYRFLRVLEHRLQLEEEQQVHTVPEREEPLDRLARVLGYRDRADATASRQLERELLSHQLRCAPSTSVLSGPPLEAFAPPPAPAAPRPSLPPGVGFTDAERT
jgi:glutamate-ammonia-ligase adenylyltransferase